MTSGWRAAASCSAVAPSGAASTSYLRAFRLITRARTICGSSSTTSTRVMACLAVSSPAGAACVPAVVRVVPASARLMGRPCGGEVRRGPAAGRPRPAG